MSTVGEDWGELDIAPYVAYDFPPERKLPPKAFADRILLLSVADNIEDALREWTYFLRHKGFRYPFKTGRCECNQQGLRFGMPLVNRFTRAQIIVGTSCIGYFGNGAMKAAFYRVRHFNAVFLPEAAEVLLQQTADKHALGEIVDAADIAMLCAGVLTDANREYWITSAIPHAFKAFCINEDKREEDILTRAKHKAEKLARAKDRHEQLLAMRAAEEAELMRLQQVYDERTAALEEAQRAERHQCEADRRLQLLAIADAKRAAQVQKWETERQERVRVATLSRLADEYLTAEAEYDEAMIEAAPVIAKPAMKNAWTAPAPTPSRVEAAFRDRIAQHANRPRPQPPPSVPTYHERLLKRAKARDEAELALAALEPVPPVAEIEPTPLPKPIVRATPVYTAPWRGVPDDDPPDPPPKTMDEYRARYKAWCERCSLPFQFGRREISARILGESVVEEMLKDLPEHYRNPPKQELSASEARDKYKDAQNQYSCALGCVRMYKERLATARAHTTLRRAGGGKTAMTQTLLFAKKKPQDTDDAQTKARDKEIAELEAQLKFQEQRALDRAADLAAFG
jgi:hypothetical protein